MDRTTSAEGSIARYAVIWVAAVAGGMLAFGIISLLMNFGAEMIPHIAIGLGLIALIGIAVAMMMRMFR
ncbi:MULTISPECIES: hypothetical protein [unclassified Microbacterium]|uniref:hypothetical protein n=1 Tax=unclassified Microbacterium TaxID=2609290 RepID=UPI0028833F9E|nr:MULTISPECIES: hypothetical protein [unclassified Microbacterium]